MEEYQGLQITYRNTAELIPYARNARTHSEEQVAQLAASIKEFGFNAPIAVDDDSMVLCGHGRLLAARKLGMETVPTVCLAHLSKTQKKAYILADNRLAMNAGWDDELLKLEIADLSEADFPLETLGFDDMELDAFLNPEEASVTEPEDEAQGGGLTVTVSCADADEQSALYAELKNRGLKVSMGGANG